MWLEERKRRRRRRSSERGPFLASFLLPITSEDEREGRTKIGWEKIGKEGRKERCERRKMGRQKRGKDRRQHKYKRSWCARSGKMSSNGILSYLRNPSELLLSINNEQFPYMIQSDEESPR